ncbi:hypothetical protein KY311_03540 [Candidatus Woesearchaeota archaeon]|nr:hypothetical protein [Candidatus Woesearchaeota archaeon]
MKHLLGVSHNSRSEAEKVLDRIRQISPKMVGLELRTNYEHMPTECYFDHIARQLKQCSIAVLALENPDYASTYLAALQATAVREGEKSIEDIEFELKQAKFRLERTERGWTAPEIIKLNEMMVERYEKTLEILAAHKTLDDVIGFLDMSSQIREEFMKALILKHNPEVVVLGSGHVQNLRHQLPDYSVEYFSGFVEAKTDGYKGYRQTEEANKSRKANLRLLKIKVLKK